MAREYKFRAWHKTAQEMLYDKNPGDCLRWQNEGQPVEVMQYTGLKDRNGKEIYEGDVVTEHHAGLAYQADYFETRVVEWDNFGWMPFQRVIGGAMHDYVLNLKEFNIIGNIHTHPHLLQEQGEKE